MSNSKKPINEPNDLKGLKMRVMESPVYIDLFKFLGAKAAPMSFGEVFTTLQQGTVDGHENPASLVYASKFHEAQKYYSLTGHTYSYLAVLINDKDIPLVLITQNAVAGVDSFPLMAIPFFILAGNLVSTGGVA